jgi:GNAT superfamily N-acetyltransferase
MDTVVIEPYDESLFREVVTLLADAYVTNPINVAVFGGSGENERALNRGLFEVSLRQVFSGVKLVAHWRDQVVGFVHFVRFPDCRPTPQQISTVMPSLVRLVPDAMPRIAQWLRAWGEHDPDEVHWHLSTIAVRPDVQGKGFGSHLLRAYCNVVDVSGELGYLETDRPENVPFYKKAGFAAVGELDVLGVPTWFMRRPAAA